MKKLFTLLWFALAALAFKATAQTTTCNANFTAQFLTNTNVKFNPVSTDSLPTAYHTWNFGDGSPLSHNVSPTHTYAPGGYAVVHTIVRPGTNGTAQCSQSFTLQITVQECNLVVNFSWTVAAGNSLTYAFQNLSTPLAPTDSITWIFGDGTTSHDVNPTHTYANYGTYSVCLIVKKMTNASTPPCVRYTCKTITAVQPCNLVVNFNWTISQTNPLTYEFHNLSTPSSPTDSTIWNFGDGTTSTLPNPVHTYAQAGTYTVCLTVKKMTLAGTPPCVRYLCKTIVVQNPTPCNLVVDFAWNILSSNPMTVAFQNLSTPLAPTDSITWTFGDGTSSHDVNPTHTYTSGGSYQVCLIVKKYPYSGTTPCIRYICKTVLVTQPCTLVVDFSWNVTGTSPYVVQFHNLSTPLSPTDSITWTFGDGTTSHDVNPTHTYTAAGSYTVCLRIKKATTVASAPCIREICKTVVIQTPCNLVANFTWQPGTAPLGMYFTNTSTGAATTDSVRWTFGDGTSASSYNAYHLYAQAGTYNVCLRMQKRNPNGTLTNCISEKCYTVVIQTPCNLVVNFSWNITGTNPYVVAFTNLSTPLSPTDSITWTFGDGSTSHDVNQVHTYAQPGTYTVCLRVKKTSSNSTAPCVREICKTIVLQNPNPCTLLANFTWTATSGNAQTIYFTNTSTGASTTDSVRWTFGDGTSSSQYNTSHTYVQAGTYTVCLRMQKRNPNGTLSNCISEKCQTITVHPACNFQVTWTWHLDSANVKKVYFNNTTIIPTVSGAALWNFGDGTSATTWNAVHEYANPGKYYVCLRVEISPNCVRYKCDSITVPHPAPPCNAQSNFTVVATSANSQTFTFVPAYQNPTATYTWSFGDGTGSNVMIPTHHYTQPGTYNVCLTVWRSNNCVSTSCKTVTATTQINCDSIHVGYTYQFDPYLPNKVYFYANANFPILDQTWTITKLPASTPPNQVIIHANNPSYVFTSAGVYRVCLRAVTLGGCIKEVCREITITTIPVACTIAAYPNPVSSLVNFNVPLTAPTMINVYVYNNLNVLVKEKHQAGVMGNNLVTLTVGDLVAGHYTVKIIYGNNICNSAFQKL